MRWVSRIARIASLMFAFGCSESRDPDGASIGNDGGATIDGGDNRDATIGADAMIGPDGMVVFADAAIEKDAENETDATAPADGAVFPDAQTFDDATVPPPGDAGPLMIPSGFTERAIDEVPRHGQGIESADLDGDQDLDVIVSWSYTDAIFLYINDGTGRLNTHNVSNTQSIVAMHTATGDFDGDQDLDIAAVALFDRAMEFNSPGSLVWYENPGSLSGQWIRHDVTDDLWGLRYVAAADLTGDGRLDLITGSVGINGMSAGVRWFRGGAAGFVGPFDVDASIFQAETIQVGDVDGDGVTDVVAVAKSADEVYWYENSRDSASVVDSPTFAQHRIATVTGPYGLALANFDADPALELAISSADRIELYQPPADPRNVWTAAPIDPAFGGTGNTRLAHADFNRDGLFDLAVSSQSAEELRVYINGVSGWVPVTVISGWRGANFVAAGDLDGDQRPDVLSTTYENNGNADKATWWRTLP